MWQYDRSVRFFVWKLGHVGDAVDYTGVSFPLPLSKHVCTALCGFHFHCESENANGCCTSVWLCFFCFFYFFIIFFLFCFSFSLPGSIRWFYHQWGFSICGPALLCFRCLKWFHILAVSLSLPLSLSLFLLSCVHAIFAHLLRFVEHSHRCLGIPSLAFTIFAVHCGTVDFLSGHWTVEGQHRWRRKRSFVCAVLANILEGFAIESSLFSWQKFSNSISDIF